MASMATCEQIADAVAKKLGSSIKTKSAGSDTGMAYCSGTLASNVSFSVLDIDEGRRANVEISGSNVTTTINVPSSWNNTQIGNRAANAYNGAQNAT